MPSEQNSPPRQSTAETSFEYDESYFSRTDEQGIICAGNGVFQRISAYPWAELIGAPHSKIRHPDMPKGIFHLFWECLKADKPISGYVKNRAADGKHFWVYLVVAPIPGGYVSIGLKPIPELLAKTEALYAKLLKCEDEQGFSAKESAALIDANLKEQKYNNLSHYMASTFANELMERDKLRGVAMNIRGQQFASIAGYVQDAITHTTALYDIFKAIEAVPHNMRILASRLETAGGPIAAISSNYGSMSKEISEWLNQFVLGETSAFANLRNAVHHSRMLSAIARVMEEARMQFEHDQDQPGSPVERENERTMLKSVSLSYRAQANTFLETVEREAIVFGRAVGEMKRMIAGLSTTRMMCKIESARLPEQNESLSAIINQLDSFQHQLEERLESIGAITTTVLSAVRSLENGKIHDRRANKDRRTNTDSFSTT